MKNKSILFLLCFLCFNSWDSRAQDSGFSSEFRVSEKDLTTNVYLKDSLASALVIYESGKSYITQRDYSVITEYNRKVKILKPEGFEHATVKIFLYKNDNRYEKISEIKATSYRKQNEKFEIVKLEKSQIFKEKINEHYTTVTFTLPNIKVGSVFTYSYTLESPFIYNFHNWKFQTDIPKLHSEYHTKIPGNYIYNTKLVGWQKLDKNTNEVERECFTYGTASADCANYYYLMREIPAFIEEDYMTAKGNYLSKIEYELMQINYFDGRVDKITKDWKDADHEIKSMSLGKELRKSSAIKDLLDENILVEKDILKKAHLIFEYVQQNYVWNEEYYLFHDISVKKIIKNKTGNIGSINCLLHNILKENGIDAVPVISSTRKNGLPTKLFPVLSEFNYLLVKVNIDEKEYFLDASDKYVSFGQIPFRCLNSYGRQIDFKKGSDWVSLESDMTSMNYIDFNFKFISASVINGTINTGFSGYHALNKKKDYYPNSESYISKLEEKYDGFDIKDYQLKSGGVQDSKFKESIVLEKEFNIETNNGLYLDPFFFKFFSTNPFKLQNRMYPVDFGYKDSYVYRLSLDVGEFYEIGELPKDYRLGLPGRKGEVVCSFKKLGTKLYLVFKVNFKESKYAPPMYEGLKKMMEKVVNTQLNTIIVLNKK